MHINAIQAEHLSTARQFVPLDQESRSALPTIEAAHHLNRKPQTLRVWATYENGPIRPVRINGRLAWPTSEIRKLLNGGVQ